MKHALHKETVKLLAKRHGTGKYLLLEGRLRKNIEEIRKAFSLFPKFILAYSIKANDVSEVLKIAKGEQLFFDAASLLEAGHLLQAGIAPGKIWINTPYLTDELLEKSIRLKIQINADSIEQVAQIAKAAKGKETQIGIRFNFPDSDLSRFGVEASEKHLDALEKLLQGAPHLKLKMLHTHFSGADRSAQALKKRAQALVSLYQKRFTGSEVRVLNIGGGMAGAMDAALVKQFDYMPPSWEGYAQALKGLSSELKRYDLSLAIEPGMALVADAFCFLAEVICVKTLRNEHIALLNTSRLFLKPTGHEKSLSFEVIRRSQKGSKKKYKLAGITCMENDIIGYYNGALETGDLVLFKNVGAYTLSCRPDFIFEQPEIISFNHT